MSILGTPPTQPVDAAVTSLAARGIAAPLGGQTTALIAKQCRLAIANPAEMKGMPTLVMQFQLQNDEIISIALPQFLGLGETISRIEADALVQMQKMLDDIEAEDAVEPEQVTCRCGKRIFGGAAERAYCLACVPGRKGDADGE